MRLHGHQGVKTKPTRSLPPDLSQGRCVGHPDAELWSVDPSISGRYTTQRASLWANAQVEHAKRICADCPCKAACLEAALVEEEDAAAASRFGTRGGLDRYERATMPRPAAPKREQDGHVIDHRIHLAPLVPKPDLTWQANARCTQTDPDVWFPEVGSNTAKAAKRICGHCAVKKQCLAHTLTLPSQPLGVWGGTTWVERRRIQHARAEEEASA